MNAPTLWSVAEAAAATNGQGQGDWRVSGVSADSRTVQQGDLFVAIQGPKFNGHRVAADALERGAAAVMVHEHPNDLASDAPVLMVLDNQSINEDSGFSLILYADDVDEDNRILMRRFYTDQLIKLLGQPRKRSNEITQREMDIAKSTQVRFEEAAVHCINKLHKLVPTNQLAMAGGCALNGVANARILRETEFLKSTELHISRPDRTKFQQ